MLTFFLETILPRCLLKVLSSSRRSRLGVRDVRLIGGRHFSRRKSARTSLPDDRRVGRHLRQRRRGHRANYRHRTSHQVKKRLDEIQNTVGAQIRNARNHS